MLQSQEANGVKHNTAEDHHQQQQQQHQFAMEDNNGQGMVLFGQVIYFFTL